MLLEHGGPALANDLTFSDLTVEPDAAELSLQIRRWLAAGVQSGSGGIVAWVEHETELPAFEYPEITGYALTHFAGSPLVGAQLLREVTAGQRAGRWVASLVKDGRLAARSGWDGHAVYNFDLAMMANGLLAFGERLKLDALIESGMVLSSRLVEQVRQTGYLPSIDDQRSPSSREATWSTAGFAHLVKTVQCMLAAHELGLGGGLEAATAVVRKGLSCQRGDGRIVTDPGDQVTMLHPLLYAVEGLWVYGAAIGDLECLERALSAVSWAHKQMLPGGGFPRYVSVEQRAMGPEQFDVTAQFLRAARLTGLAADLSLTERRLCSVSLPVAGGGRAMPYQLHQAPVHRNVWASMFAAQACELHDEGARGDFNWRHLV